MGGIWNPFAFRVPLNFLFILALGVSCCWALNDEGYALLEFRKHVDNDPHGVFANWNPEDSDPCRWMGVRCVDGKVQKLDLSSHSLQGILTPELGKLGHLCELILNKNHFSGVIPKEIGELINLQLLDLRENNLSGKLPKELGRLLALKQLLLCDNKFEGSIPVELQKHNFLWELQCDKSSILQFKFPRKSMGSSKNSRKIHVSSLATAQSRSNLEVSTNSARRKLLEESVNTKAAGSPSWNIIAPVITRSSGAFPAVLRAPTPRPPLPPGGQGEPTDGKSTSDGTSGSMWKYAFIIPGVAVLLVILTMTVVLCHKPVMTTIRPWKTGISGQLQRAFTIGIPKLNRLELEAACEDFSNIVDTKDGTLVYKGTLSSGVEIAVASVSETTLIDWPRSREKAFQKKIDMLSRINHKNFVNLIGYCKEDEPFTRMMVFEYAPNGPLFEHLHPKEMEYLDWTTRTRIIMGIAYCLRHIHHDLNPPVAMRPLNSTSVFLTDDFSAKVSDVSFFVEYSYKQGAHSEDDSELLDVTQPADLESNVYDFGILLLEIISGELPNLEEHGSLADWAAGHLSNKQSIRNMMDPNIKSFKDDEVDIICEVIQECINPNPRLRPTMKEIASKLWEVIGITPEQACPRLSPLWWAELEILSLEGA